MRFWKSPAAKAATASTETLEALDAEQAGRLSRVTGRGKLEQSLYPPPPPPPPEPPPPAEPRQARVFWYPDEFDDAA